MSELQKRIAEVKDEKLRQHMMKLAERYPNATVHELWVMAGRG